MLADVPVADAAKMKPAVDAEKVQAGEPKVQLVVPGAAGELVAMPKATLPALAT
jgi:hypothetical protein